MLAAIVSSLLIGTAGADDLALVLDSELDVSGEPVLDLVPAAADLRPDLRSAGAARSCGPVGLTMASARMGEMVVSSDPNEELVALGLGSCIGLAIVDRTAGVAGLAHIVLPESNDRVDQVGKFADTAVPELIEQMRKAGAVERRFETAIAGGARMFEMSGGLDIGARNEAAVRAALATARIAIKAAQTGGNTGPDGEDRRRRAAGHRPLGRPAARDAAGGPQAAGRCRGGGRAMSELLTPDKIAALVDAAKQGQLPDAGAAQKPARRGHRLRTVDFCRPTKFSADQARRIMRATETFCQTANTRLSTELRVPVELEVLNTVQLTWAAAQAQLPPNSLSLLLDVAPIGTRMLLTAEQSFVLAGLESPAGRLAGAHAQGAAPLARSTGA